MVKSIFCAGSGPANHYAQMMLPGLGFSLAYGVQEADAVLLDIPTKQAEAEKVIGQMNPGQMLIGGNLPPEILEACPCLDLLREEQYLAENAAITAHCALRLAMTALPVVLPQGKTVILGWGRIGKCLGQLLRQLDVPFTITARRESDLAALRSLGYDACRVQELDLQDVRLLINTVPQVLLTKEALQACPQTVKLDLASKKGLPGEDTLWARGLPGIHAPESSGRLIARTILRLQKEGDL